MRSRRITRETRTFSASVFQDLIILKDTVIKHHRFNFSKDATVNILSSAVGLSLLILRLVNIHQTGRQTEPGPVLKPFQKTIRLS